MSRNVESEQLEGVDRGWSWVIALACCFGSLVLAIFRAFGVLFVAFIGTFGVTREEASWPMVVFIAVLNLTGPFSGILGQRFGIRPIIIIGAIIAAVGISTCYFTTSLKLITFLFGCVFGIGYGLMNTLLPVILNSYFLNLRATASGIANSGSCFGSIIWPILFEKLIAEYGLSGCFLLTGGLILHLAIVGALMRPPPWMKNQTSKKKDNRHEPKIMYIKGSDDASCKFHVPHYTKVDNADKEIHETTADSGNNQKGKCMADYESNATSNLLSSESKMIESTNSNALEESTNNTLPSTITSSFISVLTCPMFYVTAFTNVCFYSLFHMYVVIIVDYALDRQVAEVKTKNILFAFSISDLFGRLCLGWITDRKFISRSRFVMLCMLLIGLTFFAFAHASDYIYLIIVSSMYGLLLGCTMTIFSILLVDFCGIEHHAVSFGCMCFLNGIASFTRPFLIGYFRDSIGSYSSIFYILGSLSIFVSALWLLESFFLKKRQIVTDGSV